MIDQLTFEDLCVAGSAELERLLTGGFTPEPDQLAGWELRGYNTQPLAGPFRVRKFKKGFAADPAGPGMLQGYNVLVQQNGLPNPWIDRLRHGEPIRFGLYEARPVRPGQRDSAYPRALLLDYSRGHNPLWDPSRLLRDYMVQVYRDNHDLYLGKAYGAVGPARVLVGYFVAERYNRAL
jgi:hypothetical protein